MNEEQQEVLEAAVVAQELVAQWCLRNPDSSADVSACHQAVLAALKKHKPDLLVIALLSEANSYVRIAAGCREMTVPDLLKAVGDISTVTRYETDFEDDD